MKNIDESSNLAGGFGTRFREETYDKPKPMIKIGEIPILEHIIRRYSGFGVKDFVICSGYKKEVIEKYFKENDIGLDIKVVNTGLNTMTGGRLKQIKPYLENETFCFTYGDSLNDANIEDIIKFHNKNKKLATVTVCHPPEKYGILKLQNNTVVDFEEKPERINEWVNAGYFVLEPEIFDLLLDENTIWEEEPMKKLVEKRQLIAYKHEGFYKSMDTLNDKEILENLWKENNAKWKNWK